jgi:hypothetical protein
MLTVARPRALTIGARAREAEAYGNGAERYEEACNN